jgi:cell division protein FtsL
MTKFEKFFLLLAIIEIIGMMVLLVYFGNKIVNKPVNNELRIIYRLEK